MIGIILVLSCTLVAQANFSQQKTPISPAVTVHYAWLDEIRKQGIKRAVVWIDIRFNRKGRPEEMKLNHIEYFTEYESTAPISDGERLGAIRATDLERELEALALEKAKHGFWAPDLPRPRPHPFIGGTQIEFIDDEQHPIPHGALTMRSEIDLGNAVGVKIRQNWLRSSWRKPGGTNAPVCGERTAWRVPDFGKTICQKSMFGVMKETPTKRCSSFSRREVTWHSTDSEVISLKTRTFWPGIKGVSISKSAPWALTTYVEAFRSIVSPSGSLQRTFRGT